jgi:dTDP-4-dehydrorhamnose 3,5-epimerase-like enzyme
MEPKIIEGSIFSDSRGSVSFVNDFKFTDIARFYVITNSEENPIRAWQGHKLDSKNFYCVQGSFKVSFVKIDNWEQPSKDLKVESVILKSCQSNVLHIPYGYANAVESLEKDSKLISFSTLPLDQAPNDDVRFEPNYWKTND